MQNYFCNYLYYRYFPILVRSWNVRKAFISCQSTLQPKENIGLIFSILKIRSTWTIILLRHSSSVVNATHRSIIINLCCAESIFSSRNNMSLTREMCDKRNVIALTIWSRMVRLLRGFKFKKAHPRIISCSKSSYFELFYK